MGKGKLYQRLQGLSDQKYLRLHYPGHKGKLSWLQEAPLDYTETYGTDNLLEPEEILKTLQEDATKLYGVKKSFYGVGGSTMGLYAGLFSLSQPNDRILVLRNAHKSIVQGAIMRRLMVDTLLLNFDPTWGIYTKVDLEKLEDALRKHDYSVVVVTSPDYFGNIQDLKSITALAHQYGAKVLVDEAHGAHLAFTSQSNHSAVRYGDVVVHSVHKSLGGLTGSSLVHVVGDVEEDVVEEWVHTFTTTSPSYLMMISIEEALLQAQEGDWERLERDVNQLPELLKNEPIFFYRPKPYDFTKIMFQKEGYLGDELSDALYERGVNVEMALGPYALGVVSLNTSTEDLLTLVDTLKDLPQKKGERRFWAPPAIGRKVLDPYKAQESQGKWVPLHQAQGKVSRRSIYAYPPGIPLLLPGEEIPKELVEKKGRLGIKDGRMEIINESS